MALTRGDGSFIDRGYTRLSEIKKAGEEIDARLTARI